MDKNIQIIIDYVEGRIELLDFKKIMSTNIELQTVLSNYANSINNCIFGKELVQYIEKLNNRLADIVSLQEILEGFLKRKNIAFLAGRELTREEYGKLLDIQPSWLDIDDDQGIFDKILKEMPKDVSKTQQIKWGKAKIKELFRYDKTYPRWVQSPAWPIVNGKPLVFSHQSKEKKDDERVYYYFYDPETKEQVVIEQFY